MVDPVLFVLNYIQFHTVSTFSVFNIQQIFVLTNVCQIHIYRKLLWRKPEVFLYGLSIVVASDPGESCLRKGLSY